MIAGTLEIQLMADVARLKTDMDKALSLVQRTSRGIEDAAAKMRSALGNIGGGVSAAAFGMWIKGAIDFQDQLNDLNKTTDIAIGKLAGISLMSKQTGSDLTGMAQAINKLTLEMGKAPEKFAKIGVTAKEPLEAFKQFSDVFRGISDPQLRAAVSAEALGKSWASTAPALAEGAEAIDKMVKRGEELAGISKLDAEMADGFNDSLSELQLAMMGTASNLANDMLPLLTEFVKSLTEVTHETNQADGGFNIITETLRALIVIGGNVAFVIHGIATEIGGIAAQGAALLTGNFAQAGQIGRDMAADAEKRRASFDAWEKKMMEAGKTAKAVGEASAAGVTKVSDAAAQAFINAEKASAAAKALKKELEELEKFRMKWGRDDAVRQAEAFQEQVKNEAKAAADATKAVDELFASRHKLFDLDIERQAKGEALIANIVFEAQLLGMTNIEREQAIALRELEATGIDKATDKYRELAAAMRSAVNLRAGAQAGKSLDDYFDPAKPQAFGDAIKGAFAGMSDSMTGVVNVLQTWVQKQAELNKKVEEHRLLEKAAGEAFASGDVIQGIELQAKATKHAANIEAKRSNDQLQAYADIAGAMKGFFEEGSKGYKTMEVVQRAFQAAQAISMFLQGQAAAAVAIANQGTGGDPYSAFARMAAMAAAMANLGFAVASFASGGPSGPTAESRQKAAGTGTVLGDTDAKSESILNVMEQLEDSAKIELQYQSGMLAALRNIESSLGGLASLVVRTTGLSGQYTGTTQMGRFANNNPFGTTGLLGSIWGGKSNELTDQGIQFAAQNLSEIISGDRGILAQAFSEITTTKSSFFGLVKKTSTSTELSALDQEILDQFTAVVGSLVDTTKLATGALGQSADDYMAAIKDVVVNLGTVSFKGLSGKEIEEQLTNIFSALGDDIARAAMPAIADFQKVGEGLFETIVRVSTGLESAAYALEGFGLTAIAYTDIVNKQGDVAAEIFRQSVAAVEGAGSGISQILQGVNGTVDDLADVYRALMAVRNLLRAVGEETDILSVAMLRGAGGLEALQEGLSTFNEKFFNDADRHASQLKQLSDEMRRMGVAIPLSVDGFRAFVAGIDKTTEAGARLFGQMMAIADVFYETIDAAEQLATQSREVLMTAYNREGDALRALIDRHQGYVDALKKFAKQLAMGPQALLSPEAQYQANKAEFNRVAALANGGDEKALQEFQGVAEAFLAASQQYYASSGMYFVDLAAVKGATEAAALGAQATVDVSRLQLTVMQNQLSVLGLINTNVVSFSAALAAYTAAKAGGPTVPIVGGNAGQEAVAAVAAYGQQYGQDAYYLHSGNDYAAKLASFEAIGAITGQTADQVAQSSGHSLAYWAEVQRQYDAGLHPTASSITGFAIGTNYVPRDMLAMVHEGEEIVPRAWNPSAGGRGGNEALVQEVRGLRDEVKRLTTVTATGMGRSINVQEEIAGNTGASADAALRESVKAVPL